ncbi:DUF4397 domain-containing protein [Actinospica durhamensis]|uniref:DUF4397 domain-containing protein n=1 Tax=Actinospica durhamensis TaxID=1508375 RepID=A0A941ITS3_9ACTN|nr:DUF4397 domain-containing protein [Actinospica durhamensis]MBR7834656.1 DUF4397 domain-containing protein [Actinospica durhamensis]
MAFAAAFSCVPAHAASPEPFGWIRLAHFSPDTPAVDVYLYSYGGHTADFVLDHVAYATASPYEEVAPGIYTVAMRSAGAPATSAPVISTTVTVAADRAYTIAGLGPLDALTLDVLDDQLTAPSGKTEIRLIEASLRDPAVSITASQGTAPISIRFPAVTGYTPVASGVRELALATPGGSAQVRMDLQQATTHTLVVLDSAGTTPRLLDLTDAVGTAAIPRGGVQTGLGGTAGSARPGVPVAEDVLWAAVVLAGAGIVVFAGRRLRGYAG